MDDIVAKLGWKKLAIILVGIGLLGVAFVFMSFSGIDREANIAQQKRVTQEQQQDGQASDPSLSTSGYKNNEAFKSYSSNFYTISYPESYELIPLIPNSDSLNSLQIKDPNSNALAEILVLSSSGNQVATLATPYEQLGYTKKEVAYSWGQVVEYTGVVAKTDVHQKIGFIKKEGVIIRFFASYTGKTNEAIDKKFSSMIDSIR